jgi:hypothetical protein
MSVTSVNAGGDFRVGEVLSRAWMLFTGNVIFFIAVPLLIGGSYYVVFYVLGLFLAAVGIRNPGSGGFWVMTGLALLVMLGIYVIGLGVALFGAFQRLRGQPLRPLAALQRVLTRFPPLFGLGILWGLGLIAAIFFGGFLFWIVAMALRGFAMVLAPAAYAPAIFLFVIWLVVVPACVVETLGPVGSMLRSSDLTSGYRWKVFGIFCLLIISLIAGYVIHRILWYSSPLLAFIVVAAWYVVLFAYWNCAIIMTYHDLRLAKEGVDTEQIAAIFD